MSTPINTRDAILQVSTRFENDAIADAIDLLRGETNRVFTQRPEPFTDSIYTVRTNDIWIDAGSKNYATYTSEMSSGTNEYSLVNMSTTLLNQITGPLPYITGSSLVADRFIEDNTATVGRYIGKSIKWATIGTGTHTISIYLKEYSSTPKRYAELIVTSTVAGVNKYVSYDLSTGTYITSDPATISASCVSVGNGWYRCSITITILYATNSNLQIRLSDTNGSFAHTYTGNGSSGIYAWGLMVEANVSGNPNPGKYIDNPTGAVPGVMDTTGNHVIYYWDGLYWASGQLKELDDLSSDNILTPAEKSQIIKERDSILTEQTQLNTQATAFGNMTAATTTYNTAVTTLTTYLTTLSSPYMWDDVAAGHITNIVGTTFRSTFNTFYAARDSFKVALTARASVIDTTYTNDAQALGFNPIFEDWTGTYPTGWSAIGTFTATKETTIKKSGAQAVRIITNGTDQWLYNTISWSSAPLPVGSWISGSVDIYIVSRTSGYMGIHARAYASASIGNPPYIGNKNGDLGGTASTLVPAINTVGSWQRVPFIIHNPSDHQNYQIYGLRIYLMASWQTTGNTGGFVGEVIFDNLIVDIHSANSWAGEGRPELNANNVGVATETPASSAAISIASTFDSTTGKYLLRTLEPADESTNIDVSSDGKSVRIKSNASEIDHIMLAENFDMGGNTTLTDVPGMYLPVLANSYYLLEGYLLVSSSTTGTGIKVDISVPASTTYDKALFAHASVASGVMSLFQDGISTAVSVAGTKYIYLFKALIDTAGTAGNVQLKFAAEDTTATDVIIYKTSTLKLSKLLNVTPTSVGGSIVLDTTSGLASIYYVEDTTTSGGATASITIRVDTDGNIYITGGSGDSVTGSPVIDSWIASGSGNVSDFEVLFTTATVGATKLPSTSNGASTYSRLTADRSITFTESCNYGSIDLSKVSLTIVIRKVGTTSPTYTKTVEFDLTVEAENPYI